jgi:hypothetical protein
MAVKYKYSPEQKVKFTYNGKILTGVIQGSKEGNEPLYFVWTGDGGMWVRESWIVKSSC